MAPAAYYCPNDSVGVLSYGSSKREIDKAMKQELDRLDLQHRIFRQLFDEKLALAPLDAQKLHNVLDIGTGTGIWATEFAQQHPSAKVTGTDLTPISEKGIPSNCHFVIEDACDEWHFLEPFDYIHGRAALSCFTDPKAGLISRCFSALRPGGYLELQDPLMPMSYDGPAPEDSAIVKWNNLTIQASEKQGGGRSMTNVQHYAAWMRAAGFEDVVERKYFLPCGWWKDDDAQARQLGGWQLLNWKNAMEGFTLRNMSQLGISTDEGLELIKGVERELQEGSSRPWNWVYVVWGRKPA